MKVLKSSISRAFIDISNITGQLEDLLVNVESTSRYDLSSNDIGILYDAITILYNLQNSDGYGYGQIAANKS